MLNFGWGSQNELQLFKLCFPTSTGFRLHVTKFHFQLLTKKINKSIRQRRLRSESQMSSVFCQHDHLNLKQNY